MRRIRAAIAILALAGSLLVAGGQRPAAADTQVTAAISVNVRSAPSLSASIVGKLERGQTVTATSEGKGWTRVEFRNAVAYIMSQYLTQGTTLPPPATVNAGAVRVTTTALNLRKGPGLSYGLIVVLPNRTRVTLTGKSSRGYVEVFAGTRQGWVANQYLANASGLPAVIGQRVASADLLVRTTSGSDYRVAGTIKKGTRVSVTGATQNGRAQIIYRNAVRWVTAQYLSNPTANQPTVPGLPKVVGTRYATRDLLIRSSSASSYTVITEVPKGTALDITGVKENGRAQIVWTGALRWVNATYLATTPPASTGTTYAVERGLNPNAIRLHRAVRAAFPEIKTYYGRRAGSGSDHNTGDALDIMIPNYKTAAGKALGQRIALWVKNNQPSLRVTYIIWDQRIWNVARAGDGWRYMANRGSDAANHKDHVHVSLAR